MTTKNEMKNLALFTLGQTDEVNFDIPTDPTVQKVDRIYETSRDFVLSNYYWRFVMKRKILENPLQETDTFTADAGTDFLTLVTYYPWDGLKVRVSVASGGSLPTGLSADTDYYTVNTTGQTTKLAATKGGAAIDLTTAGSGTLTITFMDLAESPYKYLFQMPDDILVFRHAFTDEGEYSPINYYEYLNIGFFTNDIDNSSNTVRLWYSADLVETEWPVYFVDYFKYKLAVDLCFNFTGDRQLQTDLFAMSEKMLLSSKNIDAKQVRAKTVRSSPFTAVRGR